MSTPEEAVGGNDAVVAGGRAVLVAGAATSTVVTLARAAAAQGARVVLATSAPASADASGACTHVPITLDRESDADAIVEAALARLGHVDALVVALRARLPHALHGLALEEWRVAVEDPLRHVFWLVRRVTDEFLGSGRSGRIVLLVESGLHPPGGHEVVAQGVRSFARSYAREYGRRALACNVIVAQEDGLPDEVVAHALFLLSQAASFVTGETMYAGASTAPL